ncbi:molybdopterin-guanine dinucleotide biosynthesis protein B [Cohnella sp. CFH 77786]|uniref:molybdopterin-guanine dinucleotide biosynthesis protein B n=1 Tax=Cohnella sp. CFH 77786 TaxID=2662265 RepID=UPI001C6085D2|nr:molybdopterin-guanine dinucleotide biosynthesis protein B [Cohnella sp. CFH 77786]MBW5445019.1 molybdopterin-guanine dinucleotide biosynthesis protein B [Cohnella sp. CFH 77786]
MIVLQVAGYKNAGKTTLACELVRLFTACGRSVATVKRDAHDADPEPEGADTRRHREAGACMTALASDSRTSWVRERPASLEELLAAMEEEGADAVIVEGFKGAPCPKLVLLRSDEDAELLRLDGIIGVVLRGPSPVAEQAALAGGWPVFRTEGRQFGPLLQYVRERFLPE